MDRLRASPSRTFRLYYHQLHRAHILTLTTANTVIKRKNAILRPRELRIPELIYLPFTNDGVAQWFTALYRGD